MLPAKIIDAIIEYSRKHAFELSETKNTVNIFYLEGIDIDGNLNSDAHNQFNDVRLILNANFQLLGNWEATTEPGRWYTDHPMNPKGAARIAFGQYRAWQIGQHGNSEPHEALVQCRPVLVYRDRNRDGVRPGDPIDRGMFGINQHYGYDLPISDIGKASAGCLVGRTRRGHRQFMNLIKADARYQADNQYIYTTAIIPADALGL